LARVLDVYLLDQKLGQLKDDGRLSFIYDASYLKQDGARALSLAMPLAEAPYDHNVCHAVFGGMLPEGDVRGHLAKALGVSERNDFSLLAEIGGECAGAVSMWPPEGRKPKMGSAQRRILTEQELEGIFKKLPTRPLLTSEGVRLSLAGAQNKLALVIDEGQLILPAEDEPSTYILKIAPEGFEGILENELFCLRLAQRAGLDVATAFLGHAGRTGYICVKRFDRERRENGSVLRLHQEDFCQALGIVPENKYQAEGGPSFVAGVKLLKVHSVKPAVDVLDFLKLAYFNFLTGNADAHGKNYSVLLPETGTVLAPAYDLICTALYPDLSQKMAMKIGSEYDPERISARHWADLAKQCELKPDFVLESIRRLAASLLEHAPALAHDLEKEAGANETYAKIQEVIGKRAAKLA
jgi:serine/threonine-protein kinase HipA